MNPASSYGWPDRKPSSGGQRRASLQKWLTHGIVIYVSAVFLDSLRFKFTNAPKTQIIFGDLDAWASGFGLHGIFLPTGIFSQYVIGSAELIAATILIATTLAPRRRFLQPLGALLGLAVMSGAVSFHLFTPLGINVDGDGGALFLAACGVWIGCVGLLILRRAELEVLGQRLQALFAPTRK